MSWPQWVCPIDGQALEDDGELRCSAGHSFPLRAGIPRFAGGETYSDAFGAQWLRFRKTQLDSYTETTISTDRAHRVLGDALWNDLPELEVLECGCGAGRFTEALLARGARVTSIDLSVAVEANQANFPQDDRHRIAQADILAPPFPPRSFDVVFCLGVVQHTPDPEQTIRALYEQVRPGGWLVLDHYSRRLQWWLSTSPIFRAMLKRFPDELGLRAVDRLVDLLLPVHRRAGRAGVLVRRLSPVQSYYGKLPLSDDVQREWARLDTHDALRDWHKHFRTPAQIERTLHEFGLVDVWCTSGGNGIEARGRRPEAS